MSSITDENIILAGMVQSNEYLSKVLPFLEDDYFNDQDEKNLLKCIKSYIKTYQGLPPKESLVLEAQHNESISSKAIQHVLNTIDLIYSIDIDNIKLEWLMDKTEKFCKDKAVYLAIMKSISIYDGSEKNISQNSIPDLLRDAIGISFDTNIGVDVFDDADEKYEYYTSPDNRIPFRLKTLNDITGGGVRRKTLNVIAAGIHVGKTMTLVDLSVEYLKQGMNVLYISMEMAEMEIMSRVDANLLQTPTNSLTGISREDYTDKILSISKKTHGKLKVKDFPTGAASVSHIRHVLSELKLKQAFTPDIIMVDYLGIMASATIKNGSQSSYFYLKAVAEELRALAKESDSAIWTAAQLTRGGISASDIEITDLAESMGIPATADFMMALLRTEELDSVNQLIGKQLKNRYKNRGSELRFILGVNFNTQSLHDVNDSVQASVANGGKVSSFTGLKESKNKSFSDFKY